MSSLLVRGATVVDGREARQADLWIVDGRVADQTAQPADEEFDASGLHVLPGVVDAHVHFNEPGRTDWEGFLTGTAAAAAGGVTTVADMPLNCHPPTLDGRALALKRAAVAEHARVDYALWGGVVPQSLDHLAELRDAGVVGVKAFLCDSGLAEYPPLDEFCLLDVMQRCAELGLLLALHAESPAHLVAGTGQGSPIEWARSRPARAEVEAVQLALETAHDTGARVHFVHISTADAARLIAQARGDGLDVSLETCPHYLVLDESDLELLGAVAKCAPPLRSSADVRALWQAVLGGEVDLIASDHSPCPPAMKDADDIWSAWGGISGVQTMLPLVLDAQRLPLPRVVQLLCANPARRLGLYPRKGALLPGSDADLALVDLDARWTVQAEDLKTRWPLSPFLGRTLRGRVVATFVRGRMVYRDGRVLGEAGYGQPA
ncbi:MAG TPA: allantoinase AllB [Chloroflexota bacterium]